MIRLAVLSFALFSAAAAAAEVRTGLDVLIDSGFRDIQGKRVGVITNQTGKSRDGRSIVSVLASTTTVQLRAIFAPEHGFEGTLENVAVSSGMLALSTTTSIPIYSLYGSTKAPTAEMLRGLDALIFDIQDIGARFYTYATTMAMAMEAAGGANIEFFVLDRPNPINGDAVEGPVLEPDIREFVAYFPVPIRHGMTVGELARLHNILGKAGARLQVIPVRGWTRDLWYDQTGLPWIKPSPNMPDIDAATLYPGIACLEFTNVSVGRGTPMPFRWIGAPWLKPEAIVKQLNKANLPGIAFSAQTFTPSKEPYKDKPIPGIQIKITDRSKVRPLHVFAHLVCALRDAHRKQFDLKWELTRKLVGTEKFLKLFKAKAAPKKIIELFEKDAKKFSATRSPFLLY